MIFIVCLFAVFAILGKIMEKTWVNPLSIFVGMWAMIVYLANLQLYGMKKVEDKVYIVIIIGVIAFLIGYILFYIHPFRIKIRTIKLNQTLNLIFSENIFNVIFFLSLIVWLVLGMITVVELASGIPYVKIRDMYGGSGTEGHLFVNPYIALIVKWFFVPCVHIIVARILYSIFDKPFKWYYYVGGLLIIVLYCLTTGSRMILLYVIFQLLFMLYLNKPNNPLFFIKRRVKKKLKLLILVVIAGIVIITLLRPADTSSVWGTNKTIYAYITLAVPLLGNWMDYIDSLGIRTHGVAFFRGVLELLGRFKFPLPTKYYEYSELISYCSDAYVPVFGAKVFNAFVSIFFYFYLDFGYIGVIMGSLIFGGITCALYRNTRLEKNEYSTMVWLIYLMAIIGSFARWQFINPAFIMMFIINRLMYKKYQRHTKS